MGAIEELAPWHFTVERWSAGSLTNLKGVFNKYESIKENRNVIRSKAVGYCRGERLWIRPKVGEVAVLFWTEDTGYFWTHLSRGEFELCFLGEEIRKLQGEV